MGSEVTCNKDDDDKMWGWALDLMKLLGRDRIMGVAIGNELDNFKNCIPGFWSGYFWKVFQQRVADLDKHGFSDTRFLERILLEGVPAEGGRPR